MKIHKKFLSILFVLSFVITISPLNAIKSSAGSGNISPAEDCSVDSNITCAICLTDYPNTRKKSGLIFTQCNHGFHINCLNQLLATATKCPMCRSEIDIVKLVGPVKAQHLERIRTAWRQQAVNNTSEEIHIPTAIARVFGSQNFWQTYVTFLSANPNIEARQAALAVLVIDDDEDNRESWLRAENLEYAAILTRHLTSLPDDAARRDVLIRPNEFGMSPLYIAAGMEDAEAMTSLLANISDSTIRQEVVNSDANVLLRAIFVGNVTLVQLLLDSGAHINAADDDGSTPLHEATYYNHPEIVMLLLERGADRNLVNRDGKTALMLARELRREIIAQILE